MKITEKKVLVIDFSIEERNILQMADQILDGLCDRLGYNDKLISPDTGELFETEELPRVRGILHLLYTHSAFQTE
jgi:hypothetical protein